MAWVTPKTNWVNSDYINIADYNRIKNNVSELYGARTLNSSVDYPDSIAVWRYGQSVSKPAGDFVMSGYMIDANVSVASHTALNNGKIIGDYKLLQSNGNLITLHFESENGQYVEPPTVIPNVVGIATLFVQLQGGAESLFDIESMSGDKTVTDLPYADEWNTICDNLEKMGTALGVSFEGKPMYAPNGDMPTATELNTIEAFTLDLYNQVNGIT